MDNNYENQQNNNYSAPTSDYNSPEQNAGPDTGYSYGNGSYGNSPYENNPYGNGSYGNSSYNTGMPGYGSPYGGVPVDENGRPLKNRYGMKIVFSILEILSCCLLNIVTAIIGIIALVFTCKANSSYKKGDTAGFKSGAKASAILLWIGLALDAVVIAVWIAIVAWLGPYYSTAIQLSYVMLESGMSEAETTERLEQILMDMMANGEADADVEDLIDKYLPELSDNNSDDFDDYDWYDDDSYYDDTAYADAEKLGEYWSFRMDGNSFTLPFSVSDFLAQGYLLDEGAEEETIASYDYVHEYFYSPDGEVFLGMVEIYNMGASEITVSEGTIVALDIINTLAYGLEYEQELTLSNGITFDSTREEVIAAYGTPTFSDADEEDPEYEYDEWVASENDYYNENYIDISYEDGMISDVIISYTGE